MNDLEEQLMSDEPTSKIPQSSTNNEAKSIKAKFTQLLFSNRTIKEENDAKKDIYKVLELDHGIPKKVSKKVEKLLEKENISDFVDEQNLIEQIYEKVRS